MKQLFVLGVAVLVLCGSGCATRGYVRRQNAKVNDQATQVQTQVAALSDKHDTDLSRVNEHATMTDSKVQEAATNSAQANAGAAQASANAARADAAAAQANASAARDQATVAQAAISAAQASAAAARADAAAAQERAVVAQDTPPPAPVSTEKPPATLPTTGSPFPLIGLSGLFSLGAAGALRIIRR
jgi:septal ring factor EnvC (AmiA/AmiB activator)